MARLGTTYSEEVPALQSGVARIVGGAALLICLIVASCGTFSAFEKVDADEILVVQDALDGELHWYTTPGVKPQWFGKTTSYLKRDMYKFEGARIRFNDGGHGEIRGSIQFDMPMDHENLTKLHTKYGSQEAIRDQIMKRTVDKVIYMTGPHMSSRESYAERRTDLITFVQDQVDHGVYSVAQRTVRETDPISGQERTRVVAEIAKGTDGANRRAEPSVVGEFGIKAFNFAIEELKYDDRVEAQIQQQQQLAMDVQTAMAEARKAEQRKLTVEQEGSANAAKAKWEQEVQKAKAVTAAEQALAVQQLAVKTAEAYKQEQLLRADADSTYKRRIIEADGALSQKLVTFERVNDRWASAFEKHGGQLVPSVVMGGAGAGASGFNAAQTFMEFLTAKTALDLGLSIKPGAGRGSSSGANGGSH